MNSHSDLYRRAHDLVSRLGNNQHFVYSDDGTQLKTYPKEWVFELGEADRKNPRRGIIVTDAQPIDGGRLYSHELRVTVSRDLVRDSIAYRMLMHEMSRSPMNVDYLKILLENPELSQA